MKMEELTRFEILPLERFWEERQIRCENFSCNGKMST